MNDSMLNDMQKMEDMKEQAMARKYGSMWHTRLVEAKQTAPHIVELYKEPEKEEFTVVENNPRPNLVKKSGWIW